MRTILLTLLTILFVSSAFAQDPRETVEYWKGNMKSGMLVNKRDEASSYMQKYWDSSQMYCIVKQDSKEWNICCAIYAAANDMTLKKSKELIEERKRKAQKNPNNKGEWVTPKIDKFQMEQIGK